MHDQHDFGGDAAKQHFETFLRRAPAAAYIRERYGFCSERSLAKRACTGDGPAFRKYGARIVLYERAELDRWAREKIGAPRTSTSDEPLNDRPQGRKESRPSGRGKARDRRAIV